MRAIALAATAVFLVTAANAADFTKPVLGLDGSPVHMRGKDSPVVTYSFIATTALLAGKQKLSGPQQLKRFDLAQKVYKAKDAKLTASDIVTIEKAVPARGMGPLIYGRMYEFLERARAE